MRWFIVFYLVLTMFISQATTYSSFIEEGGYSYDKSKVSEFQRSLEEQAQSLSQGGATDIAGSLLKIGFNYLKTVSAMATLSFEIPEAPTEVQSFIRVFFALLSWLFIASILREVVRLVPWV